MERNLRSVNGWPSLPIRVARYSTGPRESSLIRAPTTGHRGSVMMMTASESTTSRPRLTRLSAVALHDVGDRFDDISDVLIAHGRVERQRHYALKLPVADGKVGRRVAVPIPVIGVQMYRYEVDARADVALGERLDERISVEREAIEMEPQHVEVPGVLYVGALRRELQRGQRCEGRVVTGNDGFPPLLEPLELL